MRHLSPEELVDAAEGTLAPERRAHLAGCEGCQQAAAELAAVLREAADLPVQEPSPLFWDHFSTRVREALDHEAPPPRGWSGWWRWPALVPLGALALVLLMLLAGLSRPPAPAAATRATLAPAGPAPANEASRESWELVAEMVGPLDWETAGAAGLAVMPGDVDSLVLDLDEDEQRELSRLLLGELARTKS